ncbi:hybrid sensor histidine kinase/response regulator [Algoriphagus winogradskyi]|uniref:histidine kinase n=1 Tax=Algoriphagus winogradskyi TaxID=237017 RepID=A0ABY1NB03_9BACT|nr:hybrid sensor histidine kinase/response regulator [Algoriphagus winogradskyi]SMP04416.1 PAS domain S-box-containing protein [Algoriphagus winogradskyi]
MFTGKNIKILYVDDDPDDILLASTLLKRITDTVYELEGATSLEEASLKLNQNFDLYLVDYRLGKDTGLELIREIHSIRKHAPVIMLTGMSTGNIDKEALNLGVSDYLVKGEFDAQTLDRTLKYAIRDSHLMESLSSAAVKFRSIFELATDPFLLMDYEGEILEVNPAFQKKFGFKVDTQNSGETYYFKDLLPEESSRQELEQLFLNGEELYDMEALLTIEHGHSINSLISIVKQDVNIYQVLIKDLSAIKAKEEEELNLKKFSSTGRIARLLAHEVKNPLTTILLSADQLHMELPESVLLESGDLIDVIRRNCDRINHLVTQLLDSTRFTELDAKNHSINTLLDEALEHVNDRIDFKGITIQKLYQTDICDISVDGDKIKIALINLIVNAIEAIPEKGGKLILKTSIKENQCRIEIKDNGEGIPKENLERLFEPFFTSKATGSGLGLTNTQNIILSHGGSIRVKSEVGKGTSFLITFNLPS